MKVALRILIVVLVLVVVVDVVGAIYFYEIAIARGDKSFLKDSPDLEGTYEAGIHGDDGAWFDENPDIETVQIASDDGLTLQGYYLAADMPTARTAILAHGYAGKAQTMGNLAALWHDELGFNVLIPDARGHGASEGNYVGFGWHERKDYLQWIAWVLDEVGDDAEILLHGVSMGGATVAMTSGEDLPDNVKVIVADCAYTAVEDVLAYQLKQLYGLPAFPLVPSTSVVTQVRAGYSFGEASALEQVKKTRVPMLFIHGDADTFVPVEMVYPLFEAHAGEKELLIVPGASHGTSYVQQPEMYEDAVIDFVGRYIALDSPTQ